ncbi:MAG: sulfurtransferase [Gammaproteobacteria bacterium]|nr:sulfurtransferase [Gammaproteobacteria bacterium]MBJ54937.1 sulfurtransferase [Gammaproteobacteria bacterium]|tara:strand:+ start:685 stop:1575 length:891 start_codon:yes stop_codon:yes gene_type:complete
MKKIGIFVCQLLLICLFAGSASASPAGWSPLLEAAPLLNILSTQESVRVLHLTGDYDAAHIPGAVNAPYARFRGPEDNAGQLPPMTELTTLVQELGITADTPVVLVHAGNGPVDMGAATRVYWTLKSLGVEQLAVLNGGLAAWQEAGFPVSNEPVTVTASSFQPEWNDQYQATTMQIEQMLNDSATQIVDARPAAYFRGEQSTAARAGTLPGAENISFTQFFAGSRMQVSTKLSDTLSGTLDRSADSTVTFCNTGHLGSINWFVISELGGYENTRLYAESITEWAQDASRPMMNEP